MEARVAREDATRCDGGWDRFAQELVVIIQRDLNYISLSVLYMYHHKQSIWPVW
jgi:hypothetical protein